MKRMLSILAGWTAVLLSGCSGISILNAITPSSGYSEVKDIPFDAAAGLSLDVYTPQQADHATVKAPVVVFLYGGSWQSSSTYTRENYRFMGQALAAQGFVAVIPDYRLYPAVSYPTFIDDCAAAVVWAHAHAAAYGGDPQRLAVMGHSAGAYNAAMLVLDPAYLRRAGGDRAWVKAMVGLAGPYEVLPLQDQALKDLFAPAVPLQSSQPIDHVDGGNPPMLLMAGDSDDIVYVKNTNNLYERIRASGGPVEKVIYPGMGHIKILIRNASRLQGGSDIMPRAAGFMRRYTAD